MNIRNLPIVAVDADRTIRIREGFRDDPSPIVLRLKLDYWNWITMGFGTREQLGEYIDTINRVYDEYKKMANEHDGEVAS